MNSKIEFVFLKKIQNQNQIENQNQNQIENKF